jgi:hypothetical protein
MEGIVVRWKKDGYVIGETRFPSNLRKDFSADS